MEQGGACPTAELYGCTLTQLLSSTDRTAEKGGNKPMMGNQKKAHPAPQHSGKTPAGKSGTVTRLFKDYSDRTADLGESNMAPAAVTADSDPPSPTASDTSQVSMEADIKGILRNLPSRADLAQMLGKLETTFQQKMESLNSEITQVGRRVQDLEDERGSHHTLMHSISAKVQAQERHLSMMQRSLDDIDNRGRRNNLRIKGIPEAEGENLYNILASLFNLILQRRPESPVVLDRAHRSLRPKAAVGDAPRDIICRIHYYALKADILKHLRDTSGPLLYQGHEIQIYQDLSWHTLQARRALRPITDQLRSRNIRYRWGFPFALIVNTRGTTYTISTHQDIVPNLAETSILD
ncbi:Hypothetical predicted protein [Pelobates cultripes]|uniref:Uncharacterized protein n=1 Tax=Pelobates cultripes TaxID=61616 RepID=A0AAD1RXT1_PELCU|nr:Hypothetical predicted protein [Pelobates cultripes]